MRPYSEVEADARDKPAFSNGTSAHDWMSRWCDRCRHPVEVAWQEYSTGKRATQLEGYEGGCPLLMVAWCIDKTPIEWLEQDDGPDRYHCIEFRGPDDGDGEPQPQPDPQGMDGLFEQPDRGVRMLTPQPEQQSVST